MIPTPHRAARAHRAGHAPPRPTLTPRSLKEARA